MPVLTVRHVTTYRYKQTVAFGEHRMMLRPRDYYDQKLLEARLMITPEPTDIRWVHDVFGNCVAVARFGGRAQELHFESVIRLEQSSTDVLDFQIEEYARRYPFTYGADEMPDLLRAMERQYLDPEHEVDEWARQFLRHDGRTDTTELLAAMTHAIRQNLTYVKREESGVQDPVRTLRLGSGSCRDFTVLMMEAVRSLGLAAHFVSGYLYVHEGRRVWRRRHSRLAPRLSAGSRLGRVRPDQRHRRQSRPDPGRRRPRSASGGADLRYLDRLSVRQSLGMTVEVEVTAESETEAAPKIAAKAGRSRAAG